jgi:hypothetical protein
MQITAMPAPVRTIVSRLLVAAVICLSLAPPQHVHRAGIEGRTETLVHAHAPQLERARDARNDAALETSHGDHRLAVALSTDATSPSRISMSPDARATRPFVSSPDVTLVALRDTPDPRPHSPPRSVGISRGPPPVL